MIRPDFNKDDFSIFAAAAGLTIPVDRLTEIAKLSAELKEQAKLLRTVELTAADEPATIYSFPPILQKA